MRAQYIRVMFSEITRLLNHLMWLGSHGNDCGSSTILIYTFREREDLFDMYEAVSAARACMRRTSVRVVCTGILPDQMPQYQSQQDSSNAEAQWLNDESESPGFFAGLHRRFHEAASQVCVDEYETLLTDNRIWKQRTVGIGVVPA
jgi:NADH-quinone oxidoreductase subunit D